MAWLRGVLTVVLIVTAVIAEVSVLPLLGLPGAVPDAVTVTVVAIGFRAGPVRGSIAGLLAGLLIDLVPPADGLLGVTAVILVVVGYFAGLLGGEDDRPAFAMIALTGLLAGGAVLGLALIGGLVSDPRMSWERVPELLLTQTIYALVLAAFVLPGIGVLWRRVDPPPPRYQVGRQ